MFRIISSFLLSCAVESRGFYSACFARRGSLLRAISVLLVIHAVGPEALSKNAQGRGALC